MKCPHVIPSEILPVKCPAACRHFIYTPIYTPRGSSKCPHETAGSCVGRWRGGRVLEELTPRLPVEPPVRAVAVLAERLGILGGLGVD